MQMVLSLLITSTGSDNLARCGAMESLVNDMADDTWDNKAVNRISAIHFLDDDDEEDDDKVSKPEDKFHSHLLVHARGAEEKSGLSLESVGLIHSRDICTPCLIPGREAALNSYET